MSSEARTLDGFDASSGAGSGPARDRTLALAVALAGFLASIACAAASPEGIIQFDDLTHYLYAKWAWTWPSYLLDEWGRPGFTVLYFLPAGISWYACRVLSAALSAAAAYVAYCVARRLGLHAPWAAALLAWAQPLFFQLSQTTLTETPLALYIVLGVQLAGRGRWGWSAAIFSLAFVTRHECVVFAPLWVYFAWRARVRWWYWLPLIAAPLLANVLAAAADLRPAFERWFAPKPSHQYGRGGWLTFFCRSLEAFGPGIAILAIGGLGALWRDKAARLLVACVALYFATQTVIRALGLYDSGGYARFLVPLSPLVGVAALAGWNELRSADGRRLMRAIAVCGAAMLLLWVAMERQLVLFAEGVDVAASLPELGRATAAMRIATGVFTAICIASLAALRGAARRARAAVLLATAGMVMLAVVGLCGPVRFPREGRAVNEMLARLKETGRADRRIVSALGWIDYVTGSAYPPDRPSTRGQLNDATVGTIFVWERKFAGSADHNIGLDELQRAPNFRFLFNTPPLRFTNQPYLWVFEKTADGPL